MSVPNKTQGTSLLAWTAVATATASLSAELDLAKKFAASVFIYLGRQSGTAFTTGWPNIRVSASAKASPANDAWVPIATIRMAEGSNIANTTLNGAILAGATSATLTAVTNVAAGDLLFLGDASSANWEIVRVLSVAGNVVTFEEPCTYAHGNGAQVTDQAEMHIVNFDAMAFCRIRCGVDNANGGQTFAARILAITGDSIS